MADAIVYANAEGSIRVWNHGATRILRLCGDGSAWPLVGHHHSRKLACAALAGISRYDADRAIAVRRRLDLSVPAVRKDGRRVSVEFTIVPFRSDSDDVIGITAIMRDTTARFEELRALRRQVAAYSVKVS